VSVQAQKPDIDSPPGSMTAEMSLPADGSQLWLARVVVANIGIREEFDVDAVADLELLVDTACSLLAVIAAPEAVLRCRFIWVTDAITVQVSTSARSGADVDAASADWYVLKTLADRVHQWRRDDGCHIELTLGKHPG
jgi:serine/threonine-protein kinase RsbW